MAISGAGDGEYAHAPKRERLEFRASVSQRERYERAAQLDGKTLTEFLRTSADERTSRILDDQERMIMRQEAAGHLISLLVDAPPPNEFLRSAFARLESEVDNRPS